ncbi:MAG: ribonuclease H-like domain-containing protein [Bacteroidota bacterium]
MFKKEQLKDILFVDIETASVVAEYSQLSERMQELWDKKSKRYQRGDDADKSPEQLFGEKAGIHAEFARVVCISCGYLQFGEDGKADLTLKSYGGEDEREILAEFGKMLDKYTAVKGGRNLCAHNGKEFDYPFLGRRYVINQLRIPYSLQVQGKKPWEVSLLDTMELWKFGDYKAYTSLNLLAAVLDIPSPKDDIDGSDVGRVFWQDKDHERIRIYCEKDVRTTAQVMLRMSRLPLLE